MPDMDVWVDFLVGDEFLLTLDAIRESFQVEIENEGRGKKASP